MRNNRFVTVLDKLIVTDLIKTLVAALSTIVIIIVSREFIRILGKAIKGEVSNEIVTSIFALKTVVALAAFLPAAFFIAVLMVFGRMYRDHEMDALSSAGVGIVTLYRSVFLLIVPLFAFAACMSFFAAPWAEATIDQLIHRDQQSVDLKGISAGRFSEYQHGDLVFYVQEITSHNLLRHVFVQNRLQGDLGIITSETGKIQDLPDGRYLVLMDGERLQGKPGDVNFIVENFEQYAFRLEAVLRATDLDREAVSTGQLLSSNQLPDIAELQQRLAIPFGVIILGALAVPLAHISPRGGIYGNLFTAFLIYFCYANVRRLSHSWVVNGIIPPWSGFFAIYLIMLVVIGFIIVKLYGVEWIKMSFAKKAAW